MLFLRGREIEFRCLSVVILPLLPTYDEARAKSRQLPAVRDRENTASILVFYPACKHSEPGVPPRPPGRAGSTGPARAGHSALSATVVRSPQAWLANPVSVVSPAPLAGAGPGRVFAAAKTVAITNCELGHIIPWRTLNLGQFSAQRLFKLLLLWTNGAK